jgi:hypothetical protein
MQFSATCSHNLPVSSSSLLSTFLSDIILSLYVIQQALHTLESNGIVVFYILFLAFCLSQRDGKAIVDWTVARSHVVSQTPRLILQLVYIGLMSTCCPAVFLFAFERHLSAWKHHSNFCIFVESLGAIVILFLSPSGSTDIRFMQDEVVTQAAQWMF